MTIENKYLLFDAKTGEEKRGNTDYARAVDDYILGKTEGGAA